MRDKPCTELVRTRPLAPLPEARPLEPFSPRMSSSELILPDRKSAGKAPEAHCCIHQLFELQVRKSPKAAAVSCGEETLTYSELNERANRLAHHLRTLGIGAEKPVALYLDRSINMVVAILGVLKSGGAYVPIDLAYPKDRLQFMLADTRAPVVITQESLRGALPSGAATIVCLDSDWSKMIARAPENPISSAQPENLAYVIYTSGSTGKPKGVMVTHHNVVRLLKQTAPWYGFNGQDVWPLFHSYAFDVSVWELWGCLFNGGRLVVVPYLVTRSPADFYELLAREKVTVLNQTPSAFRQLIWAEQTAPAKRQLELRYVICAGEALELQSLKPWFEVHGDQKPKVVNMYGITETTVHSTYRVIRQEDLTSGVGSVIGVPIPDLTIHLVDENLQPVKAGETGEICVGGEGVARGYLNRPELTEKRFLVDPFSDQAKARMYRSGDLARINEKGEMEYLGRMDHQVKIRGFRVELGEIESALNAHAAVRESVVIAQDAVAGDKRLVAYVVPVATAPTVTDLRHCLGKSVPDYMIPAVFVFLKSLPLTTNGKVDRRALPHPEGLRPDLQTPYAPPRNPVEQGLAAIWSEVLELDRVGVDDNFFELGGDSIRSISILSRAQQQGWRLSLEQIFQHPTVAGLAACAAETNEQPAFEPTAPFQLISDEDRAKLPVGIEDAYPIGKLQLGMFYCNELDPVSAMYHDVFSYRINTVFDEGKLREAVQRLAARHPLARTSFHLAGFSEPLQLVHSKAEIPFSFEDLRHLDPAEQDQHLVTWIEAEKRRPFNRAVPPLLRFHTQLRGDRSFQFIISFHHSCLDGWSLAAVITEIFQEYAALLEGRDTRLGAPRIAYRDFIALEQQAIRSSASRKFWTDKLNNVTPQLLPRWPKSVGTNGHEQVRGPELQVADKTLAGLKHLAQKAGVPLKTVLLAAHLRVMNFLHGQNDILTGLISNGRPEEVDGEKLVGLFLNSVPLRLNLGGGTWTELVGQTFAAEQETVPHRRVPLAEIQKMLGGEAIFETAFDFVHFHVYRSLQSLRDLDLAEGHYFEANNLTTYTTFMLDVTSTNLELHIDYDPNAICRPQIEQISDYYFRTLEAMATEPDGRYEDFCPLSEHEKSLLLAEWNATDAEYPRDKRINELFEGLARKMPEGLAVVCENARLTYGELDERANDLAGQLRSLNAGPGTLVGICIDRSLEMVVALLGIFKCGAAYVPLDPAYPRERLAFMLEDANVPVLVTKTELVGILPQTRAQVLCMDNITATRTEDPARASLTRNDEEHQEPRGIRPAGTRQQGAPEARTSGSELAYVIYTSGSTGKPKGVQVTHRSVINLLFSAARKAGISAEDNLLAVTTLSFDIAALEIFMPLVIGGTVTLASREVASDGTRLAALIESSRATVMQGTPATWRLLLEAGWGGSPALKVFCGGEALERPLADDLLRRVKEVWNFYGPTETTIWSTAWKVVPEQPISIGRPLANTQVYIVDSHARPVPTGTLGELLIGGDGVSQGYLSRPELTAEKFIRNPFAGNPASRLYKTGDLACYLPDGLIECRGRIDHQVKIRGFRVEPGEVETVLRQHAGIADALVTTRPDTLGEQRLVGYLISKNGPPSLSELREFARAKLPAHMVPALFVVLKQFPLTPNGKIDLRQLPSPDSAPGQTVSQTAPPRNAGEQHLCEIWQEALMLKQVGIDDNFFDLGGDSLSATRAFARINQSFGTALTLREILEHPTIRGLSELVARNKGSADRGISRITRQPRAMQIIT